MRAVLDHIETHTQACKTFWFLPEHRLRFTAGEFAEFYLPHDSPDNRGDRRWFTISSSPDESLVSITVKFAPNGGSSFKKQLAQMQIGQTIYITEPMGDFVLPKDASIPLVFIGLGIGITPALSIVRWLSKQPEQRQLTVFHAVGNADELLSPTLFEEHTTAFVPIIRKTSLNTAKIDAHQIFSVAGPATYTMYYIAGPEQGVLEIAHSLRQAKVSPGAIVTDLFTGAAEII